MNTQILKEIGLTETEIKIYLALLETGQTTTTPIVRKAGIHASKVYEFLDKLIQKGLVSYVIKSNRKYFTASDPTNLKEFLKEKQNKIKEQMKEINKLIPKLREKRKKGKNIIKAEIFEGIKSVYQKIYEILNKGETQYIIGAPQAANKKLEGFILDWHKKRIKKGIKCKYIYDSDSRKYGKIREKMKNTSVRYLPKGIVSPMWIEIFKDYVAIGHIKEFGATLFLIQDKEIADGYLDYFKIIWKQSKR